MYRPRKMAKIMDDPFKKTEVAGKLNFKLIVENFVLRDGYCKFITHFIVYIIVLNHCT